jgi:hypothetical protein
VARSDDNFTPARPIRISDDDWKNFGRAAGFRNRAKVIGEFIDWYTRKARAAMPTRPDKSEWLPDPDVAEAPEEPKPPRKRT